MGAIQAKSIMKDFKYNKIQVAKEGGGTQNFEEKAEQFETVVQKFTGYFVPKKNIRHERFIFQKRVQQQVPKGSEETYRKETVEEFLRALQTLVKTCDYKDAEEMVLDRFVLGLLDTKVSSKLQLKGDLTLEAAVREVRQQERMEIEKEAQKAGDASIRPRER